MEGRGACGLLPPRAAVLHQLRFHHANAKINNPGDVDAWPTWTIIGDSTAAAVGVGTSVVEVPFVVPAGKALVVNTDPTVQTAVMYNYTPANGSTPEILSNLWTVPRTLGRQTSRPSCGAGPSPQHQYDR